MYRRLAYAVLVLSAICFFLMVFKLIGAPLSWWLVTAPLLLSLAGGITLAVVRGAAAVIELTRTLRTITIEMLYWLPRRY